MEMKGITCCEDIFKWHKNPIENKDFPESENPFIVMVVHWIWHDIKTDEGEVDYSNIYCNGDDEWKYSNDYSIVNWENVIAWRYIEPYEEKEEK